MTNKRLKVPLGILRQQRKEMKKREKNEAFSFFKD